MPSNLLGKALAGKRKRGVSGPSRARKGATRSPERAEPKRRARKRKPKPKPAEREFGGRPTVYTLELGQRVCRAVQLGVPIGVACAIEGIGRQTLYDWRARGKDGREPYAAFLRELERSLADLEHHITRSLVLHTALDWRAAAWWLERRKPKLYSLKQTIKLERPAGEMSDADIVAELGAMGFVRAQRAHTDSEDT